MDHDGNAAFVETKGFRRTSLEHLLHHLDLEKMIPRPQRPQLLATPLQGAVADGLRIRTLHGSAVLGRFQIRRRSEPVLHRPACAVDQDPAFLLQGKLDRPPGTDTRRDVAEESHREVAEAIPDVLLAKVRRQQAAAAVDVVADAPRRNDTVFQGEGGDAADREPISPVHIRHRGRIFHDPRQMGDVRHLPGTLVLSHALHETLAGIDDSRHAHPPLGRDPPAAVVDFFQFDLRHPGSPARSIARSCPGSAKPGGR